MILNLLAEQNLEIMEELINLKKYIKGSFEELADGLKGCFDNIDDATTNSEKRLKASLDSIKEKVDTIENVGTQKPGANSVNKPSNSQPNRQPLPQTVDQRNIAPTGPVKKKMKKKTTFLAKPKVLFIGDSVAHNTEFPTLENETNTRIHSFKTYSSVKDRRARWPHKNFADVTPAALSKHTK